MPLVTVEEMRRVAVACEAPFPKTLGERLELAIPIFGRSVLHGHCLR
jgi:hypothetical protein